MDLTARIERPVTTMAQLSQAVGTRLGMSEWIRIVQTTIDAFAAVTGDGAFIHIDPQRAARTRFGGTIAHGLLVLSLLPRLLRTATPRISDVRMSVNYGFDKVRFIQPVPVDSRVRASIHLVEVVEIKPRFFRVAFDVTVELAEARKPAATARWLLGHWLA